MPEKTTAAICSFVPIGTAFMFFVICRRSCTPTSNRSANYGGCAELAAYDPHHDDLHATRMIPWSVIDRIAAGNSDITVELSIDGEMTASFRIMAESYAPSEGWY